jgi:zinc protease
LFPEKELNRLKSQRLSQLRARLDQAEEIAGIVFPRILYGDDHPYGRPDLGTPRSVKSLTRDDAVALHKQLYIPNNSALIVVGDTTPDAITAALESALKDWKPGQAPKLALSEPPPAKQISIYLVDKPAAAQSVLSVGHIGQPRGTPDYFPLTILNSILGGQFSSRLNLNLREDKGYTYGARSHFFFREGPGPFEAECSVQTDKTKLALVELLKEVTEITGARPATDAETAFAKDRTIKGFPSRFATTSGVASTVAEVVIYRLPADYFSTYRANIEAVTKDEVSRVAKKYLSPDKLTVLVVGDRAKVEPELKSLPFGKVINAVDPEGNLLSPSAGTESSPK